MNAPTSFRTRVFTDSITRPADTTAYTAGDAICEVTNNDHFTFGTPLSGAMVGDEKKMGRPGFLSGVINSVRLESSANQSTKLDAELWLFHSDIAEVADNAAFAPTDAEMLTRVAVIDLGAAYWKVGNATAGAGGNATVEAMNLDIPYRTLASGVLFGQLVARNGYTPVSSEILTIRITATPD